MFSRIRSRYAGKKIIIIIAAIFIIAAFAVNLTGLWPFLNRPINYLVAGTPDKSCQTDVDCKIKSTHCGYCGDCGDAVNINWRQYCPFKTHFFVVNCESCPPWRAKCVQGRCQKYFEQQVFDFESCAAAGNPIMESYPRQCSADGRTFMEVLKGTGEICSQSSDCQLSMDYAVLSSCPYQAFCYQGKCAVGCPTWSDQTGQWQVKCQRTSDCHCPIFNDGKKHLCSCVDDQCVSLILDESAEILDSSSRMDLEYLSSECDKNKGIWLNQYSECENISENWCLEQEGEFDACASACRHDPKAEICTMQCVPVCKLK